MTIPPEEVVRLARLARLRLTAAEVAELSVQLGDLLGQMDQLPGIAEPGEAEDAEDANGASGVSTPLRDDQGVPDLLARRPADFAPAWHEPFYLVPRPPLRGREALDEASRGEAPPVQSVAEEAPEVP